eukprot:COSAG01_NODE_2426_length_7722_cov_2.700905_7_plen_112_part_00
MPSALADVTVTFNNLESARARPIFVHPIHNYAIIQYDAAKVSVPVSSATLSDQAAGVGDRVWLVGLRSRLDAVSSAKLVSRVRLHGFGRLCPGTYWPACPGNCAHADSITG